MSARRYFIDRGTGESRGVVLLGERPERLIIVRTSEPAIQALGARAVARVSTLDRNLGLAFLDLRQGPEAILNLTPEIAPIGEGGHIEIEIRSEARAGKGARALWLGAAEGPVRLLAPGPDLEARMRTFADGAAIDMGPAARTVADAAQDEAMETVFPLPGGGNIAVEVTRALVAVDVDVAERPGGDGRRTARSANLAAIAEAARVLRLKGLGGLVVMDLAGRGHDGPALIAAARSAFAPDKPGVALGPISRFGTLELTIPRRARPNVEILLDAGGRPAAETLAMALLRTLEREAKANRGATYEAVASPDVADAARPHLAALIDRFGARLTVRAEEGRSGYSVTAQ